MESEFFILAVLKVILSILIIIVITTFIEKQSKKGQGLEAMIVGAFFMFITMYVTSFFIKL
jgi:VIT1/CCC1 family predicted Fe2+/Mn2+ transporter